MGKLHDQLVEAAKKSIDDVLSDTSVSMHDTLDSLRDLDEHIQVLVDSLRSDIKRIEND